MGIFGRIGDIFKSNVNGALDSWEDPEKMIKQMVIDMEKEIVKAVSSLATAMAQEKKMEREYTKHSQASTNWEKKATQALQAGNEDLARQALTKKTEADTMATQYKQMYDQASAQTSQLKNQVDQLKQRLNEAKMKESTLVARSEMAKTQKKLAKDTGGFDSSSSLAKFDKLEEKILKSEAEAQALTDISDGGTSSLNDEFKALEQNSAVEDELARLKGQLNQGSAE